MSQLWKDEAAFVVSTDLVLISAILVLGLIVGLVSLRDQIVMEMADVGYAFALLQQTYYWYGVNRPTPRTQPGRAWWTWQTSVTTCPQIQSTRRLFASRLTESAPELGEAEN